MNTRRHIEEMTRFANSKEGTRVWYRTKTGTNWYTIAHPTWDKDCLYVVDDEDAELRKKSADSKNYKKRKNKMKKSILTKNQVKLYSKQIKIDGKDGRIDVTVRYDDECGNGHNSFSITGAIYDHPTSKANKNCLGSGCIHDKIKEYMPKLNHLIKWHYMTSVKPMHYIENTLYHARDGEEQNLEAARSCAIWEDATLEQLQSKELLEARLTSLMEEFIEVVEELGFTY